MRTKLPLLLACVCIAVCATGVAYAEEADLFALEAHASRTVEQIEQAAQAYEQATAEVRELSGKVAANEALLASIESRLPQQRARTAASIKNLYLFQQSAPGLLELVLSSPSFSDFISTVRYIDAIHAHNVTEVQALTSLQDQLAQTQAELSAERDAATAKQNETLAALTEVGAARSSLQAQVDELSRQAAQANDDASQQRLSLIAQQAADGATKAVEGLPAEVAQLTQPTELTAQSSAEPAEADPTLDEWTQRIDDYLVGSPLEGYGAAFAQAAADYDVDPRISPAIACVESCKGASCFLPHNAWGWGSASWPDWDSAIRGHVSGYAGTYGSTVTLQSAQAYANNDAYDYWYELVQDEMSSI